MSQPKSSNNLKKITIFVVISNFTAYKTLYEKKNRQKQNKNKKQGTVCGKNKEILNSL